MGDGNMHWVAELAKIVPVVHARHEAGAVAMADGYARVNDQIGVCTVTCGPGVTNTLTPLRAAVINRTPMVVFAGDTPSDEEGHLQEFDTEAFATVVGAHHLRLEDAHAAADLVAEAFTVARRDRIPVILSVPMDVQEVLGSPEVARSVVADIAAPVELDPASAAELLATLEGRRCVVLVGRGALAADALSEVEELVDLLDAHVGTTLKGLGALSNHPRSIGIIGGFSNRRAREVIAQAEVVLVVGASLSRHTTDEGTLFGSAALVRIDVRPASADAGVWLHVQADAKAAVRRLVADLRSRRLTSPRRGSVDWAAGMVADPESIGSTEAAAPILDPVQVVRAISNEVPAAAQVVVGVGHFWNYFIENYTPKSAGRTHFHYQFGAIAQGFPSALGVAAGRPAGGTLVVEGDGSLLMSLPELETWARYQLPLLAVIMNDGAYGAEVHKLAAHRQDPRHAVFGYSPFADLATALGIEAHTPSTVEALAGHVRDYFARQRPLLIDARIPPYAMSRMYQRTVITAEAGHR
ncbi:thiamine pyrophosphate-binding protein [Leifsonia bigeumensis]|uniref:Thiamine pyrophosphate-binding protein n=2 Tax=Leifsonella bigeumensis TaxID=433643 RepID=A0ABP7F8X6_9MICO